MGEGQFEVMMGEFGDAGGRIARPRAGQLGGGKGARCSVKERTAGAVSRAFPFVIVPSPRSFQSPLPFRLFQRMVVGGGWWRMKALLELKKPTLNQAGKGWSPGIIGCSG